MSEDTQKILLLLTEIKTDLSELKVEVSYLKKQTCPYFNQSQIMSSIQALDSKVNRLIR